MGNIEPNGTSAFLDAQQVHLRENKTSGFIEIQVKPDRQVIFVFAPGVLAGTYLIENETSKPIQAMDLSAVWAGYSPIRIVELPQTIARMIWLALEAPLELQFGVSNKALFSQQMETWKNNQFSGMVEILTEQAHGLFGFGEGCVVEAARFTRSTGEFNCSPSAIEQFGEEENIQVMMRKPNPAAQSYQCFTLRRGFLAWSHFTLSRYQELAGQKLIRLMHENIKNIAQPWGWKIYIENSQLRDEHFFSYAQTAAQAYRAVMMEIGAQMEQVVGNALAQRILNDAFEKVAKEPRMALELHRLIPAAFST